MCGFEQAFSSLLNIIFLNFKPYRLRHFDPGADILKTFG